MNLYHYFERSAGPLRNLSDLPPAEAQRVLDEIKTANKTFAAHRKDGYLERRRELEQIVRALFVQQGGRPVRQVPHYFVVERCPWLGSWYQEGAYICLPIDQIDKKAVSFTYGDMFPTFSPIVQDGKEYRNKVYIYEQILPLIERYGLPQHWNADGTFGPERYIEAQVWCELPEELLILAE